MSEVGDIYQVRVTSGLGLQAEAYNMFYYQQTSATGVAGNVIGSFQAQVVPSWVAALNNHLTLSEIQVLNLFDLADFQLSSLGPVSGVRGGDALPPAAAFGFFSNRSTRAVRRGQKRFMGVSESDQEQGDILPAAYTVLGTLASAMAQTISTGSPLQSFVPVVVKRIPYVVGGETRYRLPTNLAEATVMRVTQWFYQDQVTNQVSRKP